MRRHRSRIAAIAGGIGSTVVVALAALATQPAWAGAPGPSPDGVLIGNYGNLVPVPLPEDSAVGETVVEVRFLDPDGDPFRCKATVLGSASQHPYFEARHEPHHAEGTMCVVYLSNQLDFESIDESTRDVGAFDANGVYQRPSTVPDETARFIDFELRARKATAPDVPASYGPFSHHLVRVEDVQEGPATGSVHLEITGLDRGDIVPGTTLTAVGTFYSGDGIVLPGDVTRKEVQVSDLPASDIRWFHAGSMTEITEASDPVEGRTYTVREADIGERIHASVRVHDRFVGGQPIVFTSNTTSLVKAVALPVVSMTVAETDIRNDGSFEATFHASFVLSRAITVKYEIKEINDDATEAALPGALRGTKSVTIPSGSDQASTVVDLAPDGDSLLDGFRKLRVKLLPSDSTPDSTYVLANRWTSADIMTQPIEAKPQGSVAVLRSGPGTGSYDFEETLEADTSSTSDQGGLEYVFHDFEWVRTHPVTGAEEAVQRGSSATYTVRPEDSRHELHVRASFRTARLGFTGTYESDAPQPVRKKLGTMDEPLGVLAVTLDEPTGESYAGTTYGCGDRVSLVAHFNGAIPIASADNLERATMRLRVTVGGRTMWLVPNGQVGNDDTRIEFHYKVRPNDRVSRIYATDVIFAAADRGGDSTSTIAVARPRKGVSHYENAIGRWVNVPVDGSQRAHGTSDTTVFVHVHNFPKSYQTSETIDCAVNSGQQNVLEPLTARWDQRPSNHDGSSAFALRLAFSDEVEVTPADMRDHALTVSGGTVTQAARVDGRSDRWEITVAPAGPGEVTIQVPANRACTETGALCTADGRSLSTGLATLIPGPALLTASFEEVPAEHDGSTPFQLRLAFSAPIAISYVTVRDVAVTAAGGTVTGARRVGSSARWELTVAPSGPEAVTVTLAAAAACGEPGAVCTRDGRALANAPSATVAGPPGLSVADAEVEEGPGAVLAFAVTLDRAASSTVTATYATSDGTATAGADYRASSGPLTFAVGETAKTVSVTVLDDAHDEGEETLTLVLSSPPRRRSCAMRGRARPGSLGRARCRE